MRSFFILFTILFLGCAQEKTDEPESSEFVIRENAGFTDEWEIICENLLLTQSNFHVLIVGNLFSKGNDSLKSPTLSLATEIMYHSDNNLYNIDEQLEILDGGHLPHEDNYVFINEGVRSYNDIVSEQFLFGNEQESKLLLKEYDYEEFKSAPLQYLYQRKIETLTSANSLLMELLITIEGIKVQNNP